MPRVIYTDMASEWENPHSGSGNRTDSNFRSGRDGGAQAGSGNRNSDGGLRNSNNGGGSQASFGSRNNGGDGLRNSNHFNGENGVLFKTGRGHVREDRSDGDDGSRNPSNNHGNYNGDEENCNGRGGGRGRDGGSDRGRNDDTDGFIDRPAPYIPPAPSNDEKEIFGQGISTGLNFAKYEKIPIEVKGSKPAKAITSFRESGLTDFLLTNVEKSGYKDPTPIQKTAIPNILAKRDVMACAQTGSGKTAAFILPILHALLTDSKELIIGNPHVVIISPTRELTNQIFNEVRKFSLGSCIQSAVIYGGTSLRYQIGNVSRGCHVLVATPGRLLDFVEKGFITFSDVRFVVLDEADRMLDMGFMSSVEEILTHSTMAPMHKRQTIMLSATFPEDIQVAAGRFLQDYIFMAIGIVGSACADVQQDILNVNKFEKRNKLLEILDKSSDPSGTIVFVETKRDTDFLASFLSDTTHPTTSIHGDREQRQREEALSDFKKGKMKILIATSVAARGLDIKNVRHVINFNLPKTIDEYVHRIGRTGRVGNSGKATSFFDPEVDAGLAADLKKKLEEAKQTVPDFLINCGGGSALNGRNNFGGRDVRRRETLAPQEELEEW